MTEPWDVEAWEAMMAMVEEMPEVTLDSLAPYKIFRQGSEFVVKNNANMVKARFKTRKEALAYLRALYANVKGAPAAAEKKKWTGKEPVPKT